MRPDDGTEKWFDELTVRRIRKQLRSDEINLHEIRPEQINDPTLRAEVEKVIKIGLESKKRYLAKPHHGPAHLKGKNVSIDEARNFQVSVDMNAMNSAINAKNMMFKQQTNEVMTAEEALAKLMPERLGGNARNVLGEFQTKGLVAGRGMLMERNGMQPINNNFGNTVQVVRLMETRQPYFRCLQTGGFGSTISLARAEANIAGQITQMDFQFMEIANVYIVQPQQTQVNMHFLEQNPQLLVKLARLRNPMIGEILVPTNSIVDNNKNNSLNNNTSRMMLDGYNRTKQQIQPTTINPVQTNSNFPKRAILKG